LETRDDISIITNNNNNNNNNRLEFLEMFKFLKRRGNLRDDNASDIITETNNINASDSAPILNRNFDLTGNGSPSHNASSASMANIHDLRRTSEVDVNFVKRSLRTIPGVFCPVALSMCSVALFMRIGFIVGNTGVYVSFGLYALAFAIFVLTGLSVCAISTNGAIQGGGVYCMHFFSFNYSFNHDIR
jgi:hypothetical protein